MNEIEEKSEQILTQAIGMGASDIHLFPQKDTTNIQFRVDQKIIPFDTISLKSSAKLISHYKFLAGMDIGERRRPQNGSIEFKFNQTIINLRISTLPSSYGESLALRLLPQEETYSLQHLSLFQNSIQQLRSLIRHSSGLILVSGPTGSGKTTTLYAMLYAAKLLLQRNIITLEDPVEKRNEHFLQMEINQKAGLTYVEGLRAILRHDPDIIMIGEIRDAQTAEIAVRAALTGHLVLSTVHAKNTISCLHRLIELGLPIHDLEETLIGIVSQRLVEVICTYCGDQCTSMCRNQRTQRRRAIYEILSKPNLAIAYENVRGGNKQMSYRKFMDLIAKGVVLGYLSQDVYDQSIGDLDEE